MQVNLPLDGDGLGRIEIECDVTLGEQGESLVVSSAWSDLTLHGEGSILLSDEISIVDVNK